MGAPKFEYMHKQHKLSSVELNRLGEASWELVSHTALLVAGEIHQYYVFKRQKE